MPAIEELLRPYVEAISLAKAESALGDLVDAEELEQQVLGDGYDELADEAANAGDCVTAARLERKAIDAGCRDQKLALEMLGWYLLKAGSVAEGEALYAQLRAEHPDDSEILVTLGHARSDAGLQDQALAAFDEAVIVAKRVGDADRLDHARIERRAEREHVGLPADPDDELAPEPRPLIREQVAWTLAWFPPDQQAAALARWPTLAEDLGNPIAYARRLEGHLRELHLGTGRRPSIAPLDVEELTAWAASQGLDPDSRTARSRYAADIARAGRAIQWPPGRNDACWCRSGRKYKRCCGAA